MKKANKRATQKTTAESANGATINAADTITAETVLPMAEVIGLKTLKTVANAGGNPKTAEKRSQAGKPSNNSNYNFIYKLYAAGIGDVQRAATERKAAASDNPQHMAACQHIPASDAADIIHDIAAELWTQEGHKLQDEHPTAKNKDGTPATVLRAAFRTGSRTIYAARQVKTREPKIEDIDPNGDKLTYITAPKYWDVSNADWLNELRRGMTDLNPTKQQQRILRLAIAGYSRHQIASQLGVTRQTVITQMKRLQAKVLQAYEPTKTTAKWLQRLLDENAADQDKAANDQAKADQLDQQADQLKAQANTLHEQAAALKDKAAEAIAQAAEAWKAYQPQADKANQLKAQAAYLASLAKITHNATKADQADQLQRNAEQARLQAEPSRQRWQAAQAKANQLQAPAARLQLQAKQLHQQADQLQTKAKQLRAKANTQHAAKTTHPTTAAALRKRPLTE